MDSLAQARDGLARLVFELPDSIDPRAGGVDDKPESDLDHAFSVAALDGRASETSVRMLQRDHASMVENGRAKAGRRRDRVEDEPRVVGLAFIEHTAQVEPFGAQRRN